jgi:hypothetical protein
MRAPFLLPEPAKHTLSFLPRDVGFAIKTLYSLLVNSIYLFHIIEKQRRMTMHFSYVNNGSGSKASKFAMVAAVPN